VSIHCFSAILIKRGVLLLIRISVLSLKDSAYITDCYNYSYKYSTENSEISLISI